MSAARAQFPTHKHSATFAYHTVPLLRSRSYPTMVFTRFNPATCCLSSRRRHRLMISIFLRECPIPGITSAEPLEATTTTSTAQAQAQAGVIVLLALMYSMIRGDLLLERQKVPPTHPPAFWEKICLGKEMASQCEDQDARSRQ